MAPRGRIIVRDALAGDFERLRAIHEQQGIDYAFPDLDSPLFFVKKVAETDGEVTGALVLRLCAETLLLLAPGAPRDKFAAMEALQESVLREAYARGLDEIHAAIPEIGFDRRLRQLGWEKDRPGWHLWTRQTAPLNDLR